LLKKLLTSSLIVISAISISAPSFADSLWNDTSIASWYTDRRPTFVIGGLVTINVSETTKASQRSTLQSNKILQNAHKWEIPARDPSTGLFTKQLKIDNQNVFNGQGVTTRDGSLILTITAHIEDILPNGNLVLRGRKQLQINDEISEIIFSGIVRRDDVDLNNTISSSRVANMQMDVKGTGPVSARSTGGLISRMFNFLL
jgi:flagellar L-ring protein precursor FlgH